MGRAGEQESRRRIEEVMSKDVTQEGLCCENTLAIDPVILLLNVITE